MIIAFDYILNKEKKIGVDAADMLEQMNDLELEYRHFYEDFDYKGCWEALKTILTNSIKGGRRNG